jgi:hypothetical protein
MSTSTIKTGFTSGEISPGLWGHTDLAKLAAGCSTLRNCYVNYRAGASSRGGLAFVGQCKAPGSGLAPRVINFQFNVLQSYGLEFGDHTLRFVLDGGYVTEAPKTITNATQASDCVLSVAANGWSNGDWIFVQDVRGMTPLNSREFIVTTAATNTVGLLDTFGDPVNSFAFSPYAGGGTAARILEIATPYALEDLPWLKVTQSADVMSICCVNQQTGTEYAPQELTRVAATVWTLAPLSVGTSINAPGRPSLTASNPPPAGQDPTQYQAVVTAVDGSTGQESVASLVGTVDNSANIALTAGSITVAWLPIPGAAYYNIYLAPAAYNATVPPGSVFGYIGSARGNQFLDQNIVQDVTRTPPLHLDPFARGAILDGTPTAFGTAYVQATTVVTINTSTGSGAIIEAAVDSSGQVISYIVQNGGHGYAATDTITITDSGGGTGATGSITVGPQTGTYPSVVAYFQQSRMYANTQNAPDTYFKSQPGAYTNFDSSNPPISSDALIGTPWAQQVNGIQWMVPMTFGLVVLTGLGAWQLSGSNNGPLTPSDQQAQSEAYNGISPTVPPIRIDDAIEYVQEKGGIVREIKFNWQSQTFTGPDRTILSNHLFQGFHILQWAWAQEPWRVMWAVRDDGRLLSQTYVADQDIFGWGRHDTNGLFVSVAVVSEPPVDAPYFIVRRFVPGKAQWAYYMERMDNRIWPNAETVWAVDSGLALSLPTPDATLNATSSGVGAGVTFRADSAIFDGTTIGVAGQVIRMGGGKAIVTQFVSPTTLVAEITMRITDIVLNDPERTPIPALAGNWSITTPVSTVFGLDHLEGFVVTGLADGAVIPPTVVSHGQISLATPASALVIGLPYQAQLQTMILNVDTNGETSQGKRKKNDAVTLRQVASRGVKLGTNQPNASMQENQAEIPWGQGNQDVGKMIEAKVPENLGTGPDYQPGPGAYLPLYSGDLNELVDGDWDLTGMIAAQQDYPLPMNVIALIPESSIGDSGG